MIHIAHNGCLTSTITTQTVRKCGQELEEVQRFQNYLVAVGKDEEPDKRKVAMLLHVIGEEAVEVYNAFTWDIKETVERDGQQVVKVIPDQKDKLDCVLQKSQDYCTPKNNVVFQSHKFFSRYQQTGEGIDQYLTELKLKAQSCEFDRLETSLTMSQPVRGICDDVVREKLLRVDNLTLDKAVTICRAAEVVKVQTKEISKAIGKAAEVEVKAVSKQLKPKTHKSQKTKSSLKTYADKEKDNPSSRSTSSKQPCKKCGYEHVPRRCPAYHKFCSLCHLKGHFAKCCLKSKRVNYLEEECTESDCGSDYGDRCSVQCQYNSDGLDRRQK